MNHKEKRIGMVMAVLASLSLLLAGCAPTATSAPTAKPAAPAPTKAPAAPAATTAPAAAPTAKPAAPAPTSKPAADQPKSGGVLRSFQTFDTPHFDVHQASSTSTQQPLQPVYNGLIQFDQLGDPGKIVGDLAKSWEVSADGLVYTFQLNEGVKWHDGKPFTSEDVRFNFERWLDPPKGVASPRRAWFDGVTRVTTPNDHTLTINLAYQRAAFLPFVASGWTKIMPKHVMQSKGDMRRDAVGTGPFKYKDYVPGTSFEVVKNGDYFVKGRPYLNGIMRYVIKDPATAFAALRTQRIDITPISAGALPLARVEAVQKELTNVVAIPWRHMGFVYLVMNVKAPPFSDLRVRQAVSLAIDRQAAGKVVPEGTQVGGFTLPGGKWALPQGELMKMPGYRQPKDADIAEAKKLLAEAGYPQGFKTKTLARLGIYMLPRAEFAQNELKKVGIDLELDLKEDAGLYEDLYAHRYTSVAYGEAIGIEDPDEYLLTYYHSKGPKNYSLIADEALDQLLEKQSRTLDYQERLDLALKAQRRIFELVPSAILYFIQPFMAYWKDVRNFSPGNGAYERGMFQDVWLAR